MKFAAFEEMRDGLPIWRLQVEDPAAANDAIQFSCRQVNLPHGPVFALALTLHDGHGKPLIFHYALIAKSPGFANLKKAGAVLLLFERHGFISGGEKRIPVDLSSLSPDFGGSEQALTDYVEGWRRELPRLKNPAAIWAELEKEKAAVASSSGTPVWLRLLITAIALLGAAVLYWKLKN